MILRQRLHQVSKHTREKISHCGVNVHFQNGIVENRIRDLQEKARKQILRAK